MGIYFALLFPKLHRISRRLYMQRLLLSLTILICTGCTAMQANYNNARYGEPVIFSSPLIVYEGTYPQSAEKTLFVPIIIEQKMPNASSIGTNIGKTIAQELASALVFPQLTYDTTHCSTIADALSYAQQNGYTLLIYGTVPYLFDSGNLANAAITLQLSIYDVENKTHLYSIQQSARIHRDPGRDMTRLRIIDPIPSGSGGNFGGTDTLLRAILDKMIQYFITWKNDAQ